MLVLENPPLIIIDCKEDSEDLLDFGFLIF